MDDLYSEALDRVGQALHGKITSHIEQGEQHPGIDWWDAREYNELAQAVLNALWGGEVPKVLAQFTTGPDRGITGFQNVDVRKVEHTDDGGLLVTLNYWPPVQDAPVKPAEAPSIRTLEFVHLMNNWRRAGPLRGPAAYDAITAYIDARLACQGAAQACAVPDFTGLEDKRMSELTPQQQDDALELWMRKQRGSFNHVGIYPRRDGVIKAHNHIDFLLQRLDQARGAK